jgi:hypothetical protein
MQIDILPPHLRPIEFVYLINGTALEWFDETKDLRVIMNGRMLFLPHIEAIIKHISREYHDPYTHETPYTSLVRLNLDHTACVWSPHQSIQSKRLERVQHIHSFCGTSTAVESVDIAGL